MTLDDIPETGKVKVQCADCGYSNDGELVLVDRMLTDSPPGPLRKGDMLEIYSDDCMDPDDRISFCPECDNELINGELEALDLLDNGSG